MATPYKGLEIYTIGHSNATAEEIMEHLRKYDIEVLVDVRSIPYSQYTPQFNREAFAQALGQSGIEYIFEGEALGGRPKDPTCYKSGKLPTGKANYLKLVDYSEVAKRSCLAFRYLLDYWRVREEMSPTKASQHLTAVLQKAQVFLRIGLSRGWEKFPDRCYLQITGVYSFPDYLGGRCFADLALSPKERAESLYK